MVNQYKTWMDNRVILSIGHMYVGITYERMKVSKNKQVEAAKIANKIIRDLINP